MVISFWTDRRAWPRRIVSSTRMKDAGRRDFPTSRAKNSTMMPKAPGRKVPCGGIFRRMGLNPAGKTPFLRIDTARLGTGSPAAGVTNVTGIAWTR